MSFTNLDGDSRVDEFALDDDGAIDEVPPDRVRPGPALPQPQRRPPRVRARRHALRGAGRRRGRGRSARGRPGPGPVAGSILRIDPRGSDGSAYAVPDDNPFVDQQGARPEVWLKGVRNPWRFSFDVANGDLWIGDVGQNQVEEIDHLPAEADGRGAGRGPTWAGTDGGRPALRGWRRARRPHAARPQLPPPGGLLGTGGYVYRGTAIPELFGPTCSPTTAPAT